jgi:RpiB/LacA/LacB family sugar-phosphate isomerase
MKIAIGSDHAGYHLKELIISQVQEMGHEVTDLGAFTDEHPAEDYHSTGAAVAQAVARGECERGIVICGTGIGISIAANKVPGAYAALCNDLYTAQKSREHNDSNILALGSRVVGEGLAKEIVRVWLTTAYAQGRHEPRNANLRRIEKSHLNPEG